MKIHLLHDRVLVRVDPLISKSEGGLIDIPEAAQCFSQRGTVVGVGPGAIDDEEGEIMPTEVRPGDRVSFPARSGTDLSIGGKWHRFLREDQIEVVLEVA